MSHWLAHIAGVTVFSIAVSSVAPARAMGQAESGITVGADAPIVSVNDLEGKPVDLGGYIRKQPVVLEWWATWCDLCAELLPRVKALHATYGDRVAFIGINVTVNQTPARVKRYLNEHRPPYRTLYDDRGVSIRAYKVPSTSFIAVVDANGKVVYTGTGGEQDLDPVLRQVTSN